MEIKITKTYNDAIIPARQNVTDAGFDCYAYSINDTENYLEYDLGFKIEIPFGYFGMLVARSSITNFDLMVKNSVGIIDSGYRGSVKLRTKKLGNNIYKVGDRVCQLIILPLPDVNLIESDNLDQINDRMGGFGSTGISDNSSIKPKMIRYGCSCQDSDVNCTCD
jgi:dUTP pyrophosphatase